MPTASGICETSQAKQCYNLISQAGSFLKFLTKNGIKLPLIFLNLVVRKPPMLKSIAFQNQN
ncbi:hypothetical protein HD_0560 [[Haemophilus] ducreyi 35000HP]|uniref:Uncharacterized protein n=1 Tax=Haemophilus ducreyi (strain 35000HP / ATCC 700724) TaxID=233412 RepID=Q7VNH5_HAEDU|nr:hypothetical protein HD_0560 [[Haemophilus] ducreyi 35000HP]